MKLTSALDEYELTQRRRHRGEEARRTALALAALREYLVEYSGREETEQVTPEDLYSFLLEYYPSREEPEPEVALALLEVATGFVHWLLERGERSLVGFARSEEGLRRDLPRVLEAYSVLREFAHQEDLTPSVPVGEEESEEELGIMSSGLDRVVKLDQVDYNAAQLDYYTVAKIEPTTIGLQSSSREVLKEGVAEPVPVPARASELLRVGDILYAEIAPAASGWELLEVFGVRPGEYA